ncbi:MAG: methyltransferase domain-containing protein [Ardenticatenaceae bacterium]|nr:methyltransferase domain-containing protein [Anaerolineales bacterium]MCB8920206.1 methyltransferase domain-containing protein [Ardenticatenaceae bacterium]MCB9004879.1 methyltransferase domain-containing protein [Ardenticatenaceae bacterium]
MKQPPIRPVTRSKAAAQASYDRMSRWYDWFAASERRFAVAGLRLLDAQPGERVLELGPGTGHGLAALGTAVAEQGTVVGLDLSGGMLCQAARQAQSQWVSLTQGDAAHLPFASQSFDAVFMSFTLELFDTPHIPGVLAEVRRVLVEDGRFCLVSLEKEAARPAVRLYEWVHDRLPNYADCRPIYAKVSLTEANFYLQETIRLSMWGLPVTIALTRKRTV